MLACSKDNTNPKGGASLTIANAIVGSNPLVVNFNGYAGSKTTDTLRYYKSALQIRYGGFKEISSYSGLTPLSLSQISDTLTGLYNLTLNLPVNTIHTLFLVGADTLHIDTLFTEDHPQYHSTADSTFGIRFVNLSPGSDPISVNIKGNANGSEVENLTYKSITEFKNYSATASVARYIFEIRDVASGDLLATYRMNGVNNGTGDNTDDNSWRYRNFTIALRGTPGSQGTFLISNY